MSEWAVHEAIDNLR